MALKIGTIVKTHSKGFGAKVFSDSKIGTIRMFSGCGTIALVEFPTKTGNAVVTDTIEIVALEPVESEQSE